MWKACEKPSDSTIVFGQVSVFPGVEFLGLLVAVLFSSNFLMSLVPLLGTEAPLFPILSPVFGLGGALPQLVLPKLSFALLVTFAAPLFF